MHDLLHSVDALADLARSAPEPAASWAAAMVHVWSPGSGPWPDAPHPLDPAGWTPAVVRDPHSLTVAHAQPTPMGAGRTSLLLQALRVGGDVIDVLASIEDPLAAATPQALPDLLLALALNGRDPTPHLQAAAAHAPADKLAALVLLHAQANGTIAQLAPDIVGRLDEPTRMRTLGWLGLPRFLEMRASLEHAATDGAMRAGGSAPSQPARLGARRHRARAWVESLLSGRDDVLSHALRAAAVAVGSGRTATLLVGSAAWHAAFEPSADDPVMDVIMRNAACRIPVLRIARRSAMVDVDLSEDVLAGHDTDSLVLLADDPPAEALTRAVQRGRADLAGAFVPAAPERVPALLQDPETRATALHAAAWCPTLPVLEALLALPVPRAHDDRRALCHALACMGDGVAAAQLDAIAATDPNLDAGTLRALPLALLG